MDKIKSLLKKFVKIKKEKVLVPCLEGHYLEGRCALVTGGGSGIGYSISKSFIQNGVSLVIITGRDMDRLNKAKESLIHECKCKKDRIYVAVLDNEKIEVLEKSFNKIIDEVKYKIDIFVNNAGVNCGDLFPETKEIDYDKVMNINLKGTYFISQIFVKYMIKNKIKGNILNVTSSSSLRPAISPYILSKWGERSLTLGLAKKCLKYGIIVNGIAPGSTLTQMLKNEELDNLSCDYSLTKRYLAPEEVANIATILVSDMGKMIIGDTIYITGGAGLITFDDMTY